MIRDLVLTDAELTCELE